MHGVASERAAIGFGCVAHLYKLFNRHQLINKMPSIKNDRSHPVIFVTVSFKYCLIQL